MYKVEDLVWHFYLCIITELEGCIVTWDFIETYIVGLIHTLSKTYTQTSEVFDTIIEDEKIEKEVNQ